MGGKPVVHLSVALVAAVLTVCLMAAPGRAQEPSGPPTYDGPPATEADEPELDGLGLTTLYATRDTLVLQGYPSFSGSGWTSMWGGYDVYNAQHGVARGLVYFDTSSLPHNIRIKEATLALYLVGGWPQSDVSRPITVYRVNSNWWEGTAWNSQPSYGGSYGSRSVHYGDWKWYGFDVTALVQAWCDGTRPNYGMLLRGTESSDAGWMGFGTRESQYAPKLQVKYTGLKKIFLPIMHGSKSTAGRTVASMVVRSAQQGNLRHPAGAEIFVPRGAVPRSLTGSQGEMLFTIEQGTPQDFGVPSAPAGWQFVSDIFNMGPEGFIFQTPIRTTIPLPRGFDRTQYEVAMFDYDLQQNRWENLGGQVNGDAESVSVDSVHLCRNALAAHYLSQTASGKEAGAIRFHPIPKYSFKICIESWTPKYPDYDTNFDVTNRFADIIRRDSNQCPADGLQHWILPQGTYLLSVMVYRHDVDTSPPTYIGYFQRTIAISRPHWAWESGGPDFEYPVDFGAFDVNPSHLLAGRPACMGSVTPSVGVGSVSVRLEWNANADLDLWVVDPCNNRIYYPYANRTASCQGSIGRLDQDNMCSGLVRGKPENIYWATNAPSGIYKVYVDYYQNCGGAGSVAYTVRSWVNGQVQVKRGTISPPSSTGAIGDQVKVMEFSR